MNKQRFKIVPELTVRSRKFASKLDMIMGIDPLTGQFYTTDVEEALRDLQSALRCVRKDDHEHIFQMPEYQVWLNHFPEIHEGILDNREDAEYLLLKSMLSNVDIEGVHYIFIRNHFGVKNVESMKKNFLQIFPINMKTYANSI